MPFYPAADRDVQPRLSPPWWRAGAARAGHPQHPRPPLSLGHDRGGMGGLRAAAAGPAWLAGSGGRPSSWCMRDVVDAIRYLTHNGPVWRALPADFPPAGTVYCWADKWQADGSAEPMHDDLRDRVRPAAGRGGPDGGDHRFPVS